jgi:hypothetical protein
LQNGEVLQTYEYANIKEEIKEEYIAKQNGTYIVKVYSKLTVTKREKIEGIVLSIEYSPNGNETYKKEHQVKVNVKGKTQTIKSIKYQWLPTVQEPEESTFTKECKDGETIIGKGYNGEYYLWVLIETEEEKTNIYRSERFNFDNEGPEVSYKVEYVDSETFKISANAKDSKVNITNVKLIRDEEIVENIKDSSLNFTESVTNYDKFYVICATDSLGNETRINPNILNYLHVWRTYEKVILSRKYNYEKTITGTGTYYNSGNVLSISSKKVIYQSVTFDSTEGPIGITPREVEQVTANDLVSAGYPNGYWDIESKGNNKFTIRNIRYVWNGTPGKSGLTSYHDYYDATLVYKYRAW